MKGDQYLGVVLIGRLKLKGENKMKEIICFLTAGAFVYLALSTQAVFGDKVYFTCVGLALVAGYLIKHFGLN